MNIGRILTNAEYSFTASRIRQNSFDGVQDCSGVPSEAGWIARTSIGSGQDCLKFIQQQDRIHQNSFNSGQDCLGKKQVGLVSIPSVVGGTRIFCVFLQISITTTGGESLCQQVGLDRIPLSIKQDY